jgi:hypothetical protein
MHAAPLRQLTPNTIVHLGRLHALRRSPTLALGRIDYSGLVPLGVPLFVRGVPTLPPLSAGPAHLLRHEVIPA